MPELLATHLDRLAAELRSAKDVLMFSDFDGTLVPIKDRPAECLLDPVVRQTLSALAEQDHVAVGIVSGRDLEDLRARVGLGGIAYVGNHGLEIQGPGFFFREPEAARMAGELDQLVNELAPAVAEIAGAWVQHKGLSASVHYRQVDPADVQRLLKVVRQVVTPALDAHSVVLRSGKKVLEVRLAVDWHKGTAVRWLAKQMSSPSEEPLLIYLGDDETDEDAFAALPEEITVCVGENRCTTANYSASDPEEVHRFLDWLLKIMVDWQLAPHSPQRGRVVSLNEVGGEPNRFGVKPAALHRFNASRLPRLSHSLNATSTHDTKRSEDVPARINVLSEIPREWRQYVQLWVRWNRRLKSDIDGSEAPSRNAEYLLYQTLVGTWPRTIPMGDDRVTYVARLQQYMLKVVREAKVHTSWVSPNELYESAMSRFVAGLFDKSPRHRFLGNLHDFASKVAEHGYWNSLSQLLLKIASPGVADFYQGSELWNLTLVDPDNRQPIDFVALRVVFDRLLNDMATTSGVDDRSRSVESWLNALDGESAPNVGRVVDFLQQLVAQRSDGRCKLFTTLMALHMRRRFSDLFTRGDYEPLTVVGPFSDNGVALARRDRDQYAIVIVPRLTVCVAGFGGPPPLGDLWRDTAVVLPKATATHTLRDVFCRRIVPLTMDSGSPHAVLRMADALRHVSVALPMSASPEEKDARPC